jgi:adenylate cyclase
VPQEQRRLGAIVAADVVGYSRLIGRDESGTVSRVRQNRAERLDPVLARHGGRLVKLTGDGALIEFASAVEALNASIEFQQSMAEANWGVPPESALLFRVGLHLGDLIVDGDDLYGDGVNVAARLEGAAPPGGIVISGTVHESVAGRVKAALEDLGQLELKNIERPVHAYLVKWDPQDWKEVAAAPPVQPRVEGSQSPGGPFSLPDKPSIAVLPFQNISGDPEQEYFADGMVDDIITGLSRTKRIFVIARNSSFAYKGRSPDIRQVGRELGVRYVLEGSVRRAASRMRIAGQLIDAQTGLHVWADRFEGDIADIFELQDQVTAKVVASIVPNLELAEIERAGRKPTNNLEAYDYFLRGRLSTSRFTVEDHTQALEYFYKAIALAPSFALAYARAAACFVDRQSWGWPVSKNDMQEAERLARKAVELDRTDPWVLSTAGYALAFIGGRVDEGQALIRQSIEHDPNHFLGWTALGWTTLSNGDPTALECFQRAARLNPLHPFLYRVHNGIAATHHVKGDYPQALDWSSKVLAVQPRLLLPLCLKASALAHMGRLSEARVTCDIIRTIEPRVYLSDLSKHFAVARKEILDTLKEGLRLAGLPE